MSLLKSGLYKWNLPELGNLTGYALDDWDGHWVHAALLEIRLLFLLFLPWCIQAEPYSGFAAIVSD